LLIAVAGMLSCARPVDHAASPRAFAPLGTAGVQPGAPALPWSRKTREQRMEFMGLTFHPRMKELFERFDAARYGNFRCQICHGDDMEARGFRMPATLRSLPGSEPAAAGRARDPKATDFMVEAVLPAAVELLAGDDAVQAKRIDCASCHAKE
jgi:hypothetical protein